MEKRARQLVSELEAMGIEPNDDTLGVVIRQALKDNPQVTATEVAEIWQQATEDAELDRDE